VITEKIKEEAEKARRRLLRQRAWREEPPVPVTPLPLQEQETNKAVQGGEQQQQLPLPPPVFDQLYPYH